jgi:hypothetical protein
VSLDLDSVVVVADLVPDTNGAFRLENGTVAGRWATSKLLDLVAGLEDPFGDGGNICFGSPTYRTLKGMVCKNADIFHAPSSDPSQPCDALAIAMGFTASPAVAGMVAPSPPTASICADAGPMTPDDCN